jgi:hypothetical protein
MSQWFVAFQCFFHRAFGSARLALESSNKGYRLSGNALHKELAWGFLS